MLSSRRVNRQQVRLGCSMFFLTNLRSIRRLIKPADKLICFTKSTVLRITCKQPPFE
jgi:hypothetical protein